METSMIVSQSFYPAAPKLGLASKRIYIAQDVRPGCDGTHHIYLPECELEVLVCRASKTYVAMANMCPCGAVSTDRGRTWETTHWAMMPSVVREEPVSTVTEVTLNDDDDNSLAEAQFNYILARMGVAAVVTAVMFIAVVLLRMPMAVIEKPLLFTLIAPHLWYWTRVRAPGWWAAIEEWTALTGMKVLVRLFEIEDELFATWAKRPRLLKANMSSYAFALFILITVALAGIH